MTDKPKRLIVLSSEKLEPRFGCTLCGARFYTAAAQERHLVGDSRREGCAYGEHAERAQARSWRQKAPGLFDPQHEGTHDVEFEAYVKKNAKDILLGRKRI